MTTTSVEAFAARLNTDEGFRDELAALPSPDERLKLANQSGYEITAEDMAAIKEVMGIEELSDDDLERVAGGVDDDVVISVSISLLTVAPAASAAAI